MNQRDRFRDHYVLPFESAKGELLAQIALLRMAETDLPPARQDRVAELLERLIILANDQMLTSLEEVAGIVRVRAAVIAIAARIKTRCSVSDRSIRYWTQWAIELGVLQIDVRSQKYGRREWNLYQIDMVRVRAICCKAGQAEAGSAGRENRQAEAGSGRKWPESVAAPRPESVAAPRPESVAAPSNCKDIEHTHTPKQPKPGEVVRVFLDLGVAKASTLVAEAIDRGLSPRELLAIARWFQRSQRRNPSRWQKPATVLMLRLQAATPGLPAHCGWIPGHLRQPPTKPVAVDHASRRREREANQRAWQAQPSPLEELRALQLATTFQSQDSKPMEPMPCRQQHQEASP